MKSFVFSLVLVCSLGSPNSLFAQGRGAGAGGGRPETPTRPEPAINRPSPSDNGGRQNATDRTTNAKSEARPETKDATLQLANNSGLSTQVAKLFPAGTDLGLMAGGFKNLGQFVAAAHVSQNLVIPFDQLKTKMVTDGSSLGDAIHAIKPELSEKAVKAETKKAEDQAKKDTSRKS